MTFTNDGYPTRISTASAELDRADPVVWNQQMRLKHRDVEQDGFTVREGVLNPGTISRCLSEVQRLGAEPALIDDKRIVREKASTSVRSIFDILNLSPVVHAAVEESGAVDLAREILGSEVYVHQSRLNSKPGFHGGAFYWHADFETWHAEDGMSTPRAVSASIALTDNHSFNGPLMVMPGSHRTFLQCAGATPDRYFEESLVEEVPRVGVPSEEMITMLYHRHGIEVLTGGAGSMTLFDSNLLHASSGNLSPAPRANIFVVFNSVENALGKPFSGSEPRPDFLAFRP